MARNIFDKVCIYISALLVTLSLTFSASANTQQKPVTTAVTAKEIEASVDPIIENLMAEQSVPGLALIVVKDGKIVIKKGYGYADEIHKVPVDPDSSLFHIGSVTKLFTTTAAMQLYEQGKLDLHASVNQYLTSFKVAEPFGKPITMTDLLTHSGGLHYKLMGTVTPFGEVSPPLAEHLPSALPEPARTPGFVSVYSDYGMALAGHVIEAASGESYQDYILTHILKPLGMHHSGLILTPGKSSKMAMPGASSGESFPPRDFNYSKFAPATEIHASAGDMAKFVLMQLGHTDSPILKPETLRLMQTHQFPANSDLPGWAYGFREQSYDGRHAIGHPGSWFKHLGKLTLFPDHDLGIYLVMNKRYSKIYKDATRRIADLYIPRPQITKPTGREAPTSTPLSQFEGTYVSAQYTTPYTERLMMISSPKSYLDVEADGNALVIANEPYFETKPGYFLRFDGLKNATFVRDPNNSDDLYLMFDGSSGRKRLSGFETPFSQAVLAGVSLVLMLAGLAFTKTSGEATSLKRLNAAMVSLAILFIPVVACILLFGEDIGLHISTPWWVELAFNIPWLILALFTVCILLTVKHWRAIRGSAQLATLMGTGLYMAILSNWNLI